MAGYIKNNSKLEGAKIASFSAIEMLNPFDKIGILAFDTKYQWVVPIMPAKDRDTIARELSKLNELGGTDLYPALDHAFEKLKTVDAQKKHVIILSDGKTKEADFRSLIKNMQKENISISTVAVGEGSDRKLMKRIAQWGRGRTYYTNDADKMPKIFAGDTKIASQSTIVEGGIPTFLSAQSELMTGIPIDTLPISEGMVVTYPKPGSQIIFNTEQGPLLSSWQYGLGRSIAFTGGFTGKWGKQWVEWEHFEKMTSQMIKWVQKSDPKTKYNVTITNKNDLGQFNVDVIDDHAMFVNLANLNLNILYPSNEKSTLTLNQTAPGRYLANFNAHETGAYYLTLYGDSKKEDLPTQTFSFGVPYSKEYTSKGVNTGLLELIAQNTNGKLLDISQPPTPIFNQRKRIMGAGKPIWVYFILLFTLVFILEVAYRKIIELKKTKVLSA